MLEINLNLPTLPTSDQKDAMDNATAPDATNVFVTINDLTTPTLQEVSDSGNTTTNDIQFGAGVGVLLDNGSRLREGTIDAGFGGSKGIAQICAVGYELKWEAGRQYVMDGNGVLIRHSLNNFATIPSATDDDTKGYYVGSLWTLDSGVSYICTDSTTASAVWDVYEDYSLLVPYTGATTNVDLGEYELKAGQLSLDTTPTGTAIVGTTQWNDSLGSSETLLKGGSVILKNGVDLLARIVNKVTPAATLTKANYTAVKISGATGQRLSVDYARADIDLNSADTIGLVTETIATNQEGFIITMGQLLEINTTGSLQGETWADGDVLYLSPTTAGRLTNIKPTGATGHIVVMGYVEYAHAVHGKIYVKIMNGWELDELHNVYINGVADKNLLAYESSTSLWKNKSASTLGIAPLASPTFTGTVVLPATTSIGNVSSTEIGYVDGVTSAIQTQLDAKAPITSPTFITDITTPLIIGGTAVGSNISYKSTSGTGTVSAIGHSFVVGTNGATQGLTIDNAGVATINGTTPTLNGGTASGGTFLINSSSNAVKGAMTYNAANHTWQNGGVTRLFLASSGITQTAPALSGTTGVSWTLTAGAHISMTIGAENKDVNYNLARTVQWQTGALATQRFFVIDQPTIRFVGASTCTNTATLAIVGAPLAGTNATITNAYALWVQAGKSLFAGNIELTQTVTTETVVSNRTVTIVINGTTYKLLAVI